MFTSHTVSVAVDGIVPIDAIGTHFVWLGRHFPYHCRLAVESAVVAMPTGTVHVHVFGGTSGPHLDAVRAHDQVRVLEREPEEMFDRLPVDARALLDLWERCPGPAARSNLARLAILFRFGGVYLDTDVIVLRGLHDPDRHGAYVGSEMVWSHNRRRIERGLGPVVALRSTPWAIGSALARLDIALTHGRWRMADRRVGTAGRRQQVNNAVIGAPKGTSFIAMALQRATEIDPSFRFALGPSLLDDVARAAPGLVHVVPPSRFYAVPPGQSYRFFGDHQLVLPPDAQVLHYVASNHRSLLDGLEVDDPRFATGRGAFWTEARRVRRAIAAMGPAAIETGDPADLASGSSG